MFLPTTAAEMKSLGWSAPDVILVSGDTYIDSPYSGIAVIGRVLSAAGFKVAVIAQPKTDTHADITRLGAPRLFWGVSGGCVDSMVANYTANGRRRKSDDFTPGGVNNARPDRAVIVYCNLIRAAFKPCKPLVIGGVEASLRRIAHYDFWSNRVRRPLLFDAKADFLLYGMAERAVVRLAEALEKGLTWHDIPSLCYALPEQSPLLPPAALALPAFAEVAAPTAQGYQAFLRMYRLFAAQQEPRTARALLQKVDSRVLVHNPPQMPLSPTELDTIYELPYALDVHPLYAARGKVKALDTIRFALTTHRGCYGECNFCAIAVHQGREVVSRSEASLLREARRMTRHPAFKGIISDVGGPTANMYGFECERKRRKGACPGKRCLFPACCAELKPSHARQISLLRALRSLPGVRKVFVASGLRPDLLQADSGHAAQYMAELVSQHVSGQLKLAPEHSVPAVLKAMGKPDNRALLAFVREFRRLSRERQLKQYLTYYFIAAHPGCGDSEMLALKGFAARELQSRPEQVQVFTPTPSTWSTAMYYTGLDPFSDQPLKVARATRERERQKKILQQEKGEKRRGG